MTDALDAAIELLDRVYANLDDDNARVVLADFLQELGDPRGELIAVQLASGDDAPRAKAIIAKHLSTLLGPIAPLVIPKTAVFSRGFLDRCGVQSARATPPPNVLASREWSTVRSISLITPKQGAWAADVGPLLTSPTMRSLRHVDLVTAADLVTIASSVPLRSVRLTAMPRLAEMPALARVLPSLEVFHGGSPIGLELLPFFRTALFQRVKTLVVTSPSTTGGAFTPWFEAAVACERDIAATSVELDRLQPRTGWYFKLTRDHEGAFSELEASFVHSTHRTWRVSPTPLATVNGIANAIGQRLRSIRVISTMPLGTPEDLAKRKRAIQSNAPRAKCVFEMPSS